MKADEVRLYALRGGLKKQAVCYTHFHSNKVFRGDLKENNPDIINPINQSGGTDEMEYITRIKEERSAYAQIVRDNTDYEFLIEQNPSRTDTINELISIMVEPESSKLFPDNYAEVIYLLHSNKITAVEAMKRLGMKKTTFYKLARRLMNAFSSYFGA